MKSRGWIARIGDGIRKNTDVTMRGLTRQRTAVHRPLRELQETSGRYTMPVDPLNVKPIDRKRFLNFATAAADARR
jgi:hypothetical protein